MVKKAKPVELVTPAQVSEVVDRIIAKNKKALLELSKY